MSPSPSSEDSNPDPVSRFPLIVPVGHFAGPMYTSPGAEAPESFEVRFKQGVFSLSAQEYAVWAVAHGDPERVGSESPHRWRIIDSAAEAGVTDPDPIIDSLIHDRLLLQVEDSLESQFDFAANHQIRPLALGLGNSPDNLAAFQIGMPNAARASVSYDVYHMWLFAHQNATLLDSVAVVAREAEEANARTADEDEKDRIELVSDTEALLRSLLEALPILISTSCIYVDRVK